MNGISHMNLALRFAPSITVAEDCGSHSVALSERLSLTQQAQRSTGQMYGSVNPCGRMPIHASNPNRATGEIEIPAKKISIARYTKSFKDCLFSVLSQDESAGFVRMRRSLHRTAASMHLLPSPLLSMLTLLTLLNSHPTRLWNCRHALSRWREMDGVCRIATTYLLD